MICAQGKVYVYRHIVRHIVHAACRQGTLEACHLSLSFAAKEKSRTIRAILVC